MSAVLLLSLPNGTKKIVPCPNGADPEDVATGFGTTIYQYFESEDQARLSLDGDPTRKADWV
jgi:hypothetical protein